MNYLTLFFSGRKKDVSIPIGEDTYRHLLECFGDDSGPSDTIEIESIFGQDVWINCKLLQIVRFLFEREEPSFDSQAIKPSEQSLEESEGLEEVR